MTRKLVAYLIRRKLGLKKYERFRFHNQKNKSDLYYFDGSGNIMKIHNWTIYESRVSLNYLLGNDVKVVKV